MKITLLCLYHAYYSKKKKNPQGNIYTRHICALSGSENRKDMLCLTLCVSNKDFIAAVFSVCMVILNIGINIH